MWIRYLFYLIFFGYGVFGSIGIATGGSGKGIDGWSSSKILETTVSMRAPRSLK